MNQQTSKTSEIESHLGWCRAPRDARVNFSESVHFERACKERQGSKQNMGVDEKEQNLSFPRTRFT